MSGLRRHEDRRLLTGEGRFVADLVRPETLHVAIVRSPIAHGRLGDIDTSRASALPGVHVVVTGRDLDAETQRLHHHLPMLPGLRQLQWSVLAVDKVRFVGAPVAAVVADTRALAEDAAELIRVDLAELPPLTDVDRALAPGAPLLYDDWPDNVLLRLPVEHGDPAAAFEEADGVLRERIAHHRVTGAPLEGHAALGEFDRGAGRLTLHASTQSPHFLRTVVAEVTGLADSRVRVVAPDVGGAFGNKGHHMREELLVALLARRLRRPVAWLQDRVEGLTAGVHSRQQAHDLEVAYLADGRILGLRAHLRVDVGVPEIYPIGAAPGLATAGTLTSVYDIQDYAFTVEAVVTTKSPTGGYRGYGQPEAIFSIERILDLLADHLGLDPIEVRRRNLIPDVAGGRPRPYVTAGGSRLDIGGFGEQLDDLLATARHAELRARQHEERAAGRLVGIGVAQMVESTATNPHVFAGRFCGYESATVTVHPDGRVTAAVGTTSHGQGHQTAFAKLVAGVLTIPADHVDVIEGDTDAVAYGAGTWSSRSAVMGGGAVLGAAGQVREKMTRVAAELLAAPVDDVRLVDGRFRGGGADTPFPVVAEVAYLHSFAAPSVPPGLQATVCFEPGNTSPFPDQRGKLSPAATYASGCGLAVVEVGRETGRVQVRSATIVHDCGEIIDLALVEGQIQGGFAQGLGAVLLEALDYDAAGQPQARTLKDYLMPTAADVPTVRIVHRSTPSDLPGGFRGVGESAAILAPAMLAGAVHDALRPLGIAIRQTDLRAARLHQLLRQHGAAFDLDAVIARVPPNPNP